MLHLAAGILDLQHKFQIESDADTLSSGKTGVENDNQKNYLSGETSLNSDQGFSIPHSKAFVMDAQKPPGLETQLVKEIPKESPKVILPQTTVKEGENLEGKVQQLVAMDLTQRAASSERTRGDGKMVIPFDNSPFELVSCPQESPRLHEDHSTRIRDGRSSSPESLMSDLHRSFSSSNSLEGSPTDLKEELVFEIHPHPITRPPRTPQATNHHDSVMTDSGIYEHDLTESDGLDFSEQSVNKFVEKESEGKVDGTSMHERLSGHEGSGAFTKGSPGAFENVRESEFGADFGSENIASSTPLPLQQGLSKSSHEITGAVNLSWFDSESSDFYINAALKDRGSDFAEFDPTKQGHPTPDDKRLNSPINCKKKKMVMYIEEPKRRHSTDASYTTDEDELAAYIYDPQLNDSYNTCLMKGSDFLHDPFIELHRKIQEEQEKAKARGEMFLGDPLEDPNFAMPSSPNPLVIPPEYDDDDEDDEGKDDDYDDGAFYMQVVSPFGDVTSSPSGDSDYEFVMQDSTWGVSSGETYFDLFTGQRILSTIYEFEVSSEEDTESLRMAESRSGHVEELSGVYPIEEDSFRRDSLEGNNDVKSLDSERCPLQTEFQGKNAALPSQEIRENNSLTALKEEKCIFNETDNDVGVNDQVHSVNQTSSSHFNLDQNKELECKDNSENSCHVVDIGCDKMIAGEKDCDIKEDEKEKLCHLMEEVEKGEGDNDGDILFKDNSDGDNTSSLPMNGAVEKATLVTDKHDFYDGKLDGNDVITANNEQDELNPDVNENVTCEEAPDIAIIVTTAEGKSYDSDDDFFTTDTFINTRDHYECNESDGCMVKSCNCNDNISKARLEVASGNNAHLSDDEAFTSDAETDITFISNNGHDVAEHLHSDSDCENDYVNVCNNNSLPSFPRDNVAGTIVNRDGLREMKVSENHETSSENGTNSAIDESNTIEDGLTSVNINDSPELLLNAESASGRVAALDMVNNVANDERNTPTRHEDCIVASECNSQSKLKSDSNAEAHVANLSDTEAETVLHETETPVANDIQEMKDTNVSNTEADVFQNSENNQGETDNETVIGDHFAAVENETIVNLMEDIEKHTRNYQSSDVDEISNQILSDTEGNIINHDEVLQINQPPLGNECSTPENNISDGIISTASLGEKQPVTNTIPSTDEVAEDLQVSPGLVPNLVSVCIENLIVQDSLVSDLTSECGGRERSPCRESTTQRTAPFVREECQRMQMNIGHKQKNVEKVESESVGQETVRKGFLDHETVDEEFEICVPSLPPPKPKRLYLRRFSSEPTTSKEDKTLTVIDDINSHNAEMKLIQNPIKPKRRKRSFRCPVSPPRKNKPVPPAHDEVDSSIFHANDEFDSCIENGELLRRDLEIAGGGERQIGEILPDDDGEAGDSRSSSFHDVERDGVAQGKRVGTGPEPRDPGSQRCIGLNTKQTIPEEIGSCDEENEINEEAYEENEIHEETQKTGGSKQLKEVSSVLDDPAKISEIVASIVLETHKKIDPKLPSQKESKIESVDELDTSHTKIVCELTSVDTIYKNENISHVDVNINGSDDTHLLSINNNIISNKNDGVENDEVVKTKETELPQPPKRKKKTPPIIAYCEQQIMFDRNNEIPNDDEISLHPPKVPQRTYRRGHSLPRRPKTRLVASPQSGGALSIGKAVARSASTATCRPHSSGDQLTFSVPEISSVINYDQLQVPPDAQRASVMLLEEPPAEGAAERNRNSERPVVSTPHVRRRHYSSSEVPSDKRKTDSLRRKGSFASKHYFSLPRNLVRKLTHHHRHRSDKSSPTNCFPNLFSRKQKTYDVAYSPSQKLSSEIPHMEPFVRSPSTGSVESFNNLFSFYSSMEYYESDKSDFPVRRKIKTEKEDLDPPQVPPRRHRKGIKHINKELNSSISPEGVEEETTQETSQQVTPSDVEMTTKGHDICVETKGPSPLPFLSEPPAYSSLSDAALDDSGIVILQDDSTEKPLEIPLRSEKSETGQQQEVSNLANCEDEALVQGVEASEEHGYDAPYISTSLDESVSGERWAEDEVNGKPPMQSDLLVSPPATTPTFDPWVAPSVPLQTWAERQGVQEDPETLEISVEETRDKYECLDKIEKDTPSPGPPVEPEKEEHQGNNNNNNKNSKKSQKQREEDSRLQQDRCVEVYPETVRQRQRNMMTSSNKVDIKNWTSSNGGNDTLTSPSKVKKFLPSVKALRNQFETGKTNNNKAEINGNGVNNGTLSRKSSSSNSSIASSTLEKTSSTNSLNSANGSTENLLSSNIENTRQYDPDEPVEPIFSQFKKVDEELRELMSKPPSTTGWNPRSLLKRLYYVPEAPKHHSQGTTYINIEGYLEKLPSGRKKATFWNAWKRRYFVAKDGVLYYYQNPQTDKPNMKMTLMGGKVECMEPSMVGVDDGSRDSKAGAMIGIDDGKGHYVVVRCSSKQEAERWRRALETHTVEDFASQYVQPWPIPTNPTLLRDTLVIDLGSSSVRAGVLASQATLPQVFLPSVVATERESRRQIWGFDALAPDVRSVSSIAFPVRPSHKISKYSVDLSAVSSLLQKAFADLKVDPKSYNVQLSVPRILNPNTQTELLRLLFDKYGVKSVNLTHQSILALYAYNATSGIVVDIGERMDIVPVIDGYIVDGGVSRVPYGGYRIHDHLRQFLYMRNISLINEVESYIIRHVLENICYCAHHYNTEKARCSNNPDNFEKGVSLAEYFPKDCPYEQISLDFGRFQATEGLFNPDAWGLDHPGIHKLIHKAIMECSMDIRKEMSRSIFLAGGVTQLPGLVDRLTTEIDNLTPPAIRPKVHASPYRYHAAYIGACVLAESPAFAQSRISREEWNKHGSAALRKWSL